MKYNTEAMYFIPRQPQEHSFPRPFTYLTQSELWVHPYCYGFKYHTIAAKYLKWQKNVTIGKWNVNSIMKEITETRKCHKLKSPNNVCMFGMNHLV